MQVKLGEICEVKSGKRLPQGRNLIKENTGFPYLRLVDCGEKYPIENNIHFLEKDVYEKIKQYKIFTNEVFLSVVGTIGIVGIIPEKFNGINLTENANKLVIKEEYEDNVNAEYLYYWLKSNTGQSAINKGTVGSIQPKLPMYNIENFEINLPHRKIQDKIAEILSGIDEQINRNNEIVKKLQVLGNTIYSKNAKLQTSTFNIENICKPTWGNCPAGEYILSQYSDNTIPYASGAGDIDNCISVNPKAFTNKPTRIVHKNDICISVAGTVGKIAIATEDICIGRAMLAFSNPKLYGYIYFGLNSYTSALQKKATGAIQKIVNSEHLSIINLPTYTDKVVENLNLIVDEILRVEEQTKRLNRLKEKLLPLLINGQLMIK